MTEQDAANPTKTSTKSTKAAAAKPKKRGRPKGSKNKKAAIVHAIPPGCPTCHSTKCKQQPGAGPIIREIHGTLPANGRRFTSVVIRRKVCLSCDRAYNVRAYYYDPSKWIG